MHSRAEGIAGSVSEALQLLQSGLSDRAETLLQDVLRRAPQHADALQLMGMVARQRKDHQAAVVFFQRSLQADPAQPHVCNNLGNALLDLRRHEDAIRAYADALELHPSYADAATNLGIAHLARGDASAACEALQLAVQLGPRSGKAWSSLGRAFRQAGRLEESLEAFRAGLALRPGHTATRHNMAVALRLIGRTEEAVAELRRCIAENPALAECHYNLGHCYYDLGRLEDAAASYRDAVASNPAYREAHDSLNRLYWQMGDTTRYLRSYQDALERHPSDTGLLADLANRLSLEGRTAETVALLDQALRRGVDAPDIRHRLGQALWAGGRGSEAVEQLRTALAQQPDADDYRLDLARWHIVSEQYGDALAVLAPVLERRPHDQQAIAYQGLAWRILGDGRADRLYDYDRFVGTEILRPPSEFGSIEAFNRRLDDRLTELHLTSRHPLEQTLRGGTQTMGNLFDSRVPEVEALRGMIERAVKSFVDGLPDDPDHAFLGRKSAAFRFAGSWSVRLRRQGFHINHVHSAGWISSCYYVSLPSAVEAADGHQGWIKFGETGLDLGHRERIDKMIRPEVGKLVLFPSYFYHGTVPFEDEGYRTTVAFDVVPD